MATKGEKALAAVIRELRKGAKGKDKAKDIAAAVWPAFVEAVAIAQATPRSEEATSGERWRKDKHERPSASSGGTADGRASLAT